jgi:hypothetical protein
MTEQEKKNLFLQLDRDIGTLISMLSDLFPKMSQSDQAMVARIAERMDDATPKLQALLYPESLPGSDEGKE